MTAGESSRATKCIALRRERSHVAWQRRHMGVAKGPYVAF